LIVIRPAVGSTFVLDVASVIDNEELVVKPGAPLVMAAGLYAGTSLPDNGCPMLLLDASGLAAEIGVEVPDQHILRDVRDNDPVAKVKHPSALLFIASDGIKRAVRLSVIDRMEDVDASQIKFVGGKMRVAVGEALTDILELPTIPADGRVKLLRLSDGEHCKYLAVEDVLDIFSLDGEIVASASPHLHEGVIEAFGEMVELINVFQYFEVSSGPAQTAGRKPLCFVESGDDGHWEQHILGPLLRASGYSVSFDAADENAAAILLMRDHASADGAPLDSRILHLRQSGYAAPGSVPSIYRYDRVGLLSAIESKLAGER
jgi:two-component system, chemotaxis family, sensor kinase CheA